MQLYCAALRFKAWVSNFC